MHFLICVFYFADFLEIRGKYCLLLSSDNIAILFYTIALLKKYSEEMD